MKVLFQCKRYKGKVSRAQVGDFRNATIGKSDKVIIITTGIPSEAAMRKAYREGSLPIEIIDGQNLITLFANMELVLIPK